MCIRDRFLIVLLVDAVVVCPVVVVSVTVDDVGCGDSVVVLIVVDSVTGSFQTYVAYKLCKCFVSYVQRFVVFEITAHDFHSSTEIQSCSNFCLFTIIHMRAEKLHRKHNDQITR